MAVLELEGKAFTAIDFETTGTVPGWPNEPWQIGIYRFRPGAGQDSAFREGDAFSSFLRISPERPFNQFAPGRHAMIRDELANSPTLPELWEDIGQILKSGPLVAHNLGTERSMLRAAAPLDRMGPWIDTLELSRRLLPGRASYALEDIVKDLGLGVRVAGIAPSGSGPHDALYDAIACGELLRFFVERGLAACEASA